MSDREYWDIDLKNQGRQRVAQLHAMLKKFGGIIHDFSESKYFSGKQSWRNPLVLRVTLPKGVRYKFIRESRVWLHPPQVVGIPPGFPRSYLPLRGDHAALQRKLRRSYNLHHGWIKDHGESGKAIDYRLFEGDEIVRRVLDGELDLLLHS
jgi:hypothetical protein